jgi:hypothetical protein
MLNLALLLALNDLACRYCEQSRQIYRFVAREHAYGKRDRLAVNQSFLVYEAARDVSMHLNRKLLAAVGGSGGVA